MDPAPPAPITSDFAGALRTAGMSEPAASHKAQQTASAIQLLGADPTTAWFVPGRIEFLGKHTDYAGGRSLLCAVEKGFCVVARPSADATVRFTDAITQQQAEFPLDPEIKPRTGHWSNYPMTVARRIATNFPGNLRGADVVFASDLPPAAGLSSSSALVVASFLVLCDINHLGSHPAYRQSIHSIEDLCGYLGATENGQDFRNLPGTSGVGTHGGSQDHTAILRAIPGRLVQYSFAPVQREADIPLPPDHALIVASSGVSAEKAGAARDRYNRASRAVAAIVSQWQSAHPVPAPSLAAVVRSAPDAPDQLRAMLQHPATTDFTAQELLNRLNQFLAESERIIPAAAAALAAGRLDELGTLVDESQHWAEQSLHNQIPQTIFLAQSARRLGAIAASAFGAGFGGSVWALVPRAAAPHFATTWAAEYAHEFAVSARQARFFPTAAGPPAMRLI